MSQNMDIVSFMKQHGEIDPMTALRKFNCFRLAARIYELKLMGYEIDTHRMTTKDGKTYAKYRLKNSGSQ